MGDAPAPASLIVVMGVAGAGKTTIGRMLAADLGWTFMDADDYHPPANRLKLSTGVELSDDDRAEWLATLNRVVRDDVSRGGRIVLACSALRQRYRDMLADSVPGVRVVYLKASPALSRARLMGRLHFFSPRLLPSQFATLEEPRDALVVDADAPPHDIVAAIRADLAQRHSGA